MILGFGNNVVSSLASDITASQTAISIMPGDGPLFSALLTSDFSNKSTTLKNYAKITLTDSGETAFEVCHLISVSGDTLTVIRGQEGTLAKGWSLKDVIANFSTRGSENAFTQIAHIQSGFYTSGTAGGSANALTLELPSTFFLNGSTDWALKTPVVVYPSQNNTGAATLQLTMGGRVLGTFPLYKGNKAQLTANDILKDVALVCLMDNTKTFFSVANPGAIYAGLGTAAFKDVTTSNRDITAGRVTQTADYGIGRTVGTVTTGIDFKSFVFIQGEHLFVKMDTCTNIPAGLSATAYYFISVHGVRDSDGSPGITLINYSNPNEIWTAYGSGAVGSRTWALFRSYNTGYKPTAGDVGALPTNGNAVSATKLQTARAIAGVNFDGTANISISAGNVGAYTKAEVDSRIAARGAKNTAGKAVNGWWKCGDTGVIFQWGQIPPAIGERVVRVNFPVAFPNAVRSVSGIIANPTENVDLDAFLLYTNVNDRTGVRFMLGNTAGGWSMAATWMAIGY